jgi:dTDP-4-dehydrorhamnose reductase
MKRQRMKLLVTGAAGFIGAQTCRVLLDRGDKVVGIDNLNSYYDVSLKQARLATLKDKPGFTFQKIDLADQAAISALFQQERFDRVVNLAAQAGVRYGTENPHAYAASNLTGFLNILEGCRHTKVQHLVYASSSSVYGASTRSPFAVDHGVDHPLSLYAATKKSNELMAHSYAHLFGLPVTGLRFFTVYGPWGRPDMAPFLFVRRILSGQPIDVYNFGRHNAISPTSMISSKAWCAHWTRSPRQIPRSRSTSHRPRSRRHLTVSTTSAITSRSNSWTSSPASRRPRAARRKRISCPCSPATYPRRLPMSMRWPKMSVSGLPPRSMRESGVLLHGIAISTIAERVSSHEALHHADVALWPHRPHRGA